MSDSPEVAAVLEAGGPGLAAGLRATEARLAAVAAAAGDPLAGYAGGTLAAGGKRLRPLLVLICAGSDDPGGPVVAAATAVELLHMATLVHDDVLDGAELRRGTPTVFASAGPAAATATGDFLFARAFSELVATGDADAVRALSAAASALARGELLQREDAWSADVTAERYFERCALKTGSLFSAAARLGALLGGRGGGLADALARFGDRIGLAFQLLDDVLDVSGPTDRTGKQRGADLLDGTVTLPLILARERDPGLAALDLRAAVADPPAAAEVCDRIAATGALEAARAPALDAVADAKRALGGLALEAPQLRALELVADGVVDRYA